VTSDHSYINGERSTDTDLVDLALQYNRPIRVRIEVQSSAKNQRGMNLFGSSFGDHPQDIILSFVRYTEKSEK
jgi:predicted transcriptional regulator